jgi:hypothetical protein
MFFDDPLLLDLMEQDPHLTQGKDRMDLKIDTIQVKQRGQDRLDMVLILTLHYEKTTPVIGEQSPVQ